MSNMRWFSPLIHLLLLFLQLPICKSSSIPDLFSSWCQQYEKKYTSDQEKQYRLQVFEQNYEYVTRHNAVANASYTLALNAFADLTTHEFKAKYLGLSLSSSDSVIRLNSRYRVDGDNLLKESEIPSSLDWRSKGAVTGVKDQGSCGMFNALFVVASTIYCQFTLVILGRYGSLFHTHRG